MSHKLLAAVAALFLLVAGCGDEVPALPDAGPVDGGAAADAGPIDVDAGLVDVDAGPQDQDAGAAFVIGVVSFDAGPGAGFGQSDFPQIVEGPPHGGGERAGSTDVLSLGVGGVIVLELGEEIVDAPGPDFTVFENAFAAGEGEYQEPGAVAVSDDGASFTEFPCDPDAGVVTTCAGMHPVYASPDNGISPLDPSVSGGDPLDLAAIGVERARYVRIRDLGLGGQTGPTAGFDLDAVAVVHAAP